MGRPSERISVDGKGASMFEILVPGSTNNLMDPILLELAPGEKLARQSPHSGEQFGYVLRGTATLDVAKETAQVPSGHCFYFTSNKTHQICNKSDSVVRLLWITTPPQM